LEQRKKQRQQPEPQRIKSNIQSVAGPARPVWILNPESFGSSAPEWKTVTVQMASPAPAATSPIQLPAVTVDAALWERLISSQPNQNLISPADGDHPRGMIQQPALDKLLESREPFTGLVVSIGINDSDSSMWHSVGLMQSVGSHIASLLGEQDFSCRTAYDEFVMVCPGEQGANSQRRLNHISERLWNYQLRGIGACSILFSWGGVEVQDQPLAEAIASATERMRETKRIGNSRAHLLAV
jgi:hypothetical protein